MIKGSNRALLKSLLRVTFAASLILVALRDYVFGDGLFVYRDWSWPLSTQLTQSASFSTNTISNGAPDPFGFSRTFLTWPLFVINQIVTDAAMAEKIFVIYLFSVFMFLAYLLSTQILHLLNKQSLSQLGPWKAEAFVSFIVTFCFANFWSLQQLSVLNYTYVVEFMLIGISLTLILSHGPSLRTIGLCGTALSLCVLLDPNLYIFGFLTLTVPILAMTFRRKSMLDSVKKCLIRLSTLFGVSLPALITVLYVLSVTTGTGLRAPGTYLRSSANLPLSNAVRLFGYWWSMITYAPPSILWSKAISQLPAVGSPPYMILPPGLGTSFWLASTWFVPVFAFSALALKHYRKVSIPSSIVAFCGLLMTQPSIFPIPYILAGELSGIPIIGGAFLTIFAIPDHILIMVAISYVLLVSIGTFALLGPTQQSRQNPAFRAPSKHVRAVRIWKNRIFRSLFVVGILSLILFPSWQFFSGSFFPSGFVSGLEGNGVPAMGTFSPSKVPQDMKDAYDWMLSQPGNFNIFWPGPEGATYPWSNKSTTSVAQVDSPKPTFLTQGRFPATLQYLIRSNLTADIAPYLAALNVRYLVLQPYSSTGLGYSWGVDDFGTLKRIIDNSPGITLVRSQGDVSIYAVERPWGSIYSPDLVLGYNSNDEKYGIAYNILESAGTRASISEPRSSQKSLCFDQTDCDVSILSPTYLAGGLSNQTVKEALMRTIPLKISYTLDPSSSTNLPNPDQFWTVANWGASPVQINLEDSIRWTFSSSSVISMSYNGTVTDGKPGGLRVPAGVIPIVRVRFAYRALSNSDISLRVLIPLLNSQLITDSILGSGDLPSAGEWTTGSFNATLPPSASFFTTRIEATGSEGWVEIKDVTMSITMGIPSGISPFGMVLPVNHSAIRVSMSPGYNYFQIRGEGVLSQGSRNFTLTQNAGLYWFSLYSPPGDQLIISGRVVIACVVVAKSPLPSHDPSLSEGLTDMTIKVARPSAVVFARTFAPGYSLNNGESSLSPSPTLDGLNLFVGADAGIHTVSLASLVPSLLGYGVTLTVNLLILITIFRRGVFLALRRRAGQMF